MALGALATQSCEFTGKHFGYHDRDHYDHDRYYHEGQSDGNNYRSDRPSIDVHLCTNACQRAGGDGAGLPSTSKRRASVKKRMAGIMAKTRQLAQLLLSKSCGALAYSDPLD